MKFKNIKKNKKEKSPSNSRKITEGFKISLPKLDLAKLFRLYHGALRIFVLVIFLVTAIVVGLDLQNNLKTKKSVDVQREILSKDLFFWQNFIDKNPNFPDAYFQLSSLQYRLGDVSSARKYLEKGLLLNPNSENGKKLEDLLK